MIKMIKNYLILGSCFLLLGCFFGSVQIQTHNSEKIYTKEVSSPDLNKIVIAKVGEEMVKKGSINEKDALILHKDIILNAKVKFPPGTYIKYGFNKDYGFYSEGGDTTLAGRGMYMAGENKVSMASMIFHNVHGVSLILSTDTKELCIQALESLPVFNLSVGTKNCINDGYEPTKLQTQSNYVILTYSGRIADKVILSYRVVTVGTGQQAIGLAGATSQDIEVNLKESNKVLYKGVHIEIIEANDNSIKYKVIRNFL